MTGSRARRKLGLMLLGLLAAPAAAAERPTQLAQAGAPIQLLPPGHPGAVEQAPLTAPPSNTVTPNSVTPNTVTPNSVAPGTVTPVTPAGALAPANPTGPKGIEVNRLAGIDVDTLGTLDPQSGGLGLELWRGMKRAELQALIPALPEALPSSTLRDLQRRLLLSTAAAPEGPPEEGPSIAALRARKLAAMGATEDLHALASILPSRIDDEGLARSRVEANFLGADNNAACIETKALIHRYHDVFWQKALIFCQLVDGKHEEAEMGLSLLRDQGDGKDAAFFALADRLGGNHAAKIAALAQPTPLLLAMLATAKEGLPADSARSFETATIRTLAVSNLAPPELRLAAAERAGAIGLLDASELGAVYDKVALSTADLANPIAKARAEYGPHARALLYHAAKAQKSMPARAEIITAALLLARGTSAYSIAVLANLPLMGDIHPAPEFAGFALEAGRALYFAGHGDAAEAWLQFARQNAHGSQQAAEAAIGLWPYARLAGSKLAPLDASALTAWRATQTDVAPDIAAKRAARLFGLLGAFGDKLPLEAWQPLYAQALEPESAAMPSVASWHGIAEASAAARGESLIMILLALGDRAPQDMNPLAVIAAVEALRRLGLESGARQLAIEAAIAGGI